MLYFNFLLSILFLLRFHTFMFCPFTFIPLKFQPISPYNFYLSILCAILKKWLTLLRVVCMCIGIALYTGTWVDFSRTISLKYTYLPSTSRHWFPVTSHLGVRLQEPLFITWWYWPWFWLGLMLILCMQSQPQEFMCSMVPSFQQIKFRCRCTLTLAFMIFLTSPQHWSLTLSGEQCDVPIEVDTPQPLTLCTLTSCEFVY